MKGCLNSMEFKDIVKNTNYEKINKTQVIYGRENDFYFVIEESNLTGLCKIRFNVTNLEDARRVVNSLRETFPEIVSGGYREGSLGENFLEVNYLGYTNGKELNELIKAITLAFKSESIDQVCTVSGHTSGLGLYLVGRRVEILSDEGFQDSRQETKRYKKNHKDGIGYAYGYALIGALLGMAIWILAMNVINFAIFAVAIPYFIFKGFTYGGATPRKIDVFVLTGLSVIAILISPLVSGIINLWMAGIPMEMAGSIVESYFSNFGSVLKGQLWTLIIVGLYAGYSIKTYLYDAPTTSTTKNKYKKLM